VYSRQDSHDWTIYQGVLSADEMTAYVSYHGSDTTGADWFVLGDELERCPPSQISAGMGCIPGHGKIQVSDGQIYIATGGPLIYEYGRENRVARLDTGLEGNHL